MRPFPQETIPYKHNRKSKPFLCRSGNTEVETLRSVLEESHNMVWGGSKQNTVSAWPSLIECWTWSQHDLSMIWPEPEGSLIRAWLRHEWYFANNIYSWTHGHYFICTKCWPIQQSSGHLYFAFWRQSWIPPLGSSEDRAWKKLNGQQ